MNRELLRKARLAGAISFREVGESADLDPSAIAHYEAGRINPSEQAAGRWSAGVRKLLASRLQAIAEAITQF